MFPPATWGAASGVAVQGMAVVVGSSKLLGLAFWLAVLAALGVLETRARRSNGSLPTVGDLVARYLRHPVARAGAVAVWLYAGWHLFSH